MLSFSWDLTSNYVWLTSGTREMRIFTKFVGKSPLGRWSWRVMPRSILVMMVNGWNWLRIWCWRCGIFRVLQPESVWQSVSARWRGTLISWVVGRRLSDKKWVFDKEEFRLSVGSFFGNMEASLYTGVDSIRGLEAAQNPESITARVILQHASELAKYREQLGSFSNDIQTWACDNGGEIAADYCILWAKYWQAQ